MRIPWTRGAQVAQGMDDSETEQLSVSRLCLIGRQEFPEAVAASNPGWLIHWTGLRENLQETTDCPIKYGVFLYLFP